MVQSRYKSIVLRLLTTVLLFASLAPTVSHALVSITGNSNFTQKICTTNAQGEATVQQVETIVLQVQTTMGKQLATTLKIKTESVNAQDSHSIASHFEHCPFCASTHFAADLPMPLSFIVQILTTEAQLLAQLAVPVISFYPYLNPPSQAPPHTSII